MSEDTKAQDDQNRKLDEDEKRVKYLSEHKHRLALLKGNISNIDQIAKEMRALLDGMDRIAIDLELDSSIVTLMSNLIIKTFYQKEIKYQAHANGIIQYWMYKRVNHKWLNVKTKHGYENLDMLKELLSHQSDFYSLKFTGKHINEIIESNDEIKKWNPILYKSIDDFTRELKSQNYSPLYYDNVNSFCKLDGFNVLENLLKSHDPLPNLKFINKVLAIVSSIKYQIQPDFRISFYLPLKDSMFEIIEKYDVEQLKQIDKEELSVFVSHMEVLIESAVDQSVIADEIIQSFELNMALKFLNTPFIEKRILGINMLISKVNMLNNSNFPCSWKRKKSAFIKEDWLTGDKFLQWLLDNKIFELFFGETLHSELVTKYYAILSFMYSKDKLTEKHFDVMWDWAINKHEAYRVNILKVLSTLALKILPSHAKFLYDKVKYMDQSDLCKFTLTLVKHINKNVWKGPVSDQAAHEAGFGKEKRSDLYEITGFGLAAGLTKINLDYLSGGKSKKVRSFSLGGDEKEEPTQQKKRHNSPVATLRTHGTDDLGLSLKKKAQIGSPKHKANKHGDLLGDVDFDIGTTNKNKKETPIAPEEIKIVDSKKQDDKQSTDEEERIRTKSAKKNREVPFDDDSFNDRDGVVYEENDFQLIKDRLEKEGQFGVKPDDEMQKSTLEEIKREESKEDKKEIELSPEEKETKEALKEETLELLWRLCQENAVVQGLELSVHKGAIDAFAIALSYNDNETKWKYIVKLLEKLEQNESVIAVCSVLKKFLQQLPEGDIEKIRSQIHDEIIEDLVIPKTRIEMIAKLDKDLSLMNELMSLCIEFKRNILDNIYDRLGRNPDREQSLETQSSLSANEAEGEDTGEDEEVQTDAASQESHQLSDGGPDEQEEDGAADIKLKNTGKQQALSEGDGFMVPKNRRISNNDEETKNEKQGANQSLSITDISMTDEENKEKDLDKRLISKRSYSASHRDPRHRNVIQESPNQNLRENEFLMNMQTNAVYQMKYFKEIEERLEFIKFILKNSDEILKPTHFNILWECFIESSFHEKERAIFFEWMTSLIKVQSGYSNTRKDGLTILDDDTIEVIFFEHLLWLDFTTIPIEAYTCFEEYFVYINVQFGQLIRTPYTGTYEVFETRLIGIQALWEIVLQVKEQEIYQIASKFLMILYKKLSPELFENLNSIKEEFLKMWMSNIKDGVKGLKEGLTTEEKENSKNRVARSLDAIWKFIDEFEGLKSKSKKGGSSVPKVTVVFRNQMGGSYEPKKGELNVSSLMTIKELTKEICESISPKPAEYELNLIYRGKDLSQGELKTLADFKFEDKGNVLITKRALYDDYMMEAFGYGNVEIEDKDLLANVENLKGFGIDQDEDVIKLALRKTKNDMNEALDMLIGPDVENLIKEVQEKQVENAFVPIIDKETQENGEDKNQEEEEAKLNLILSNKSEYFDLLFDLLNLGVAEINIQAWNLLTQIPVNKNLYSSIKNLDIKESSDWNSVMDPDSMYKLLYSLQIINSLICSPDNDQIEDEELQERYEWRMKFLKLGGFDHLLSILLNHHNIEDSLKLQRKSRSQRRKNKFEDLTKMNYSIHKAGLYMINIIKIFIQASLLASTEENNMIYNIISQSSTSPFMKKVKTSVQAQGSTLNTGTLLIDFSDGSKDNSSNNTPNFASPKSANAPTNLAEHAFKINDSDFEIVPSKPPKKTNQAKAQSTDICTQVDDFQKLIDQVTGEVSAKIVQSVDLEKLSDKLMMIIYYATRTSDLTDKNINVLIDSCFDLLLPMIISYPDTLIPSMYNFHNFENFIVLCLKFKGDDSVRKTVSNTFKTICNNYHINSNYSKDVYHTYNKEESKDDDKMENDPEKKANSPYEEPKIYFLKVLLKNLPTGGKKSDKCEELFHLLNVLIKSAPHLFKYADPYQLQEENEEIDVPNIFSTNTILAQWISEIESRPIIEERQSDYEDKVLGGYMYLANSILQIEPRLKRYAGDKNNGNDIVKKLYNYLFEMPTLDDKYSNVPKCKSKITRKRAFNLLLTLCQNDESSQNSKSSTNDNFVTLFKELYRCHYEMNEIENKVSVDVLQNMDLDLGVRSSSGFAGLRNFGATCYMNSTIQQLYMIPDFRYGILLADVPEHDKKNTTLFQLQMIFANLQETEKRYYSPKGFTKAFKFGGEQIDVRRQQDATEFISILSDTLENDLNGTQQEKLISEILGGEIWNEIKSLEDEYEYISQKPEAFISIQLDIKNK